MRNNRQDTDKQQHVIIEFAATKLNDLSNIVITVDLLSQSVIRTVGSSELTT